MSNFSLELNTTSSNARRKEIATYQVLRNVISILAEPVYGEDVMFTGREVKQGGVIISDAVVTQDALRYLRLIDKTGWVVDDSFINPLAPSLRRCGAIVSGVPGGQEQKAVDTVSVSEVAASTQQGKPAVPPQDGAFPPSAPVAAALNRRTAHKDGPRLEGLQPLASLKTAAPTSTATSSSELKAAGTSTSTLRSRAMAAQDHTPLFRIHGHPDVEDDGNVPSLARPILGGSTPCKNNAKYLITPGVNGRRGLLSIRRGLSMGESDMPIAFNAQAEPIVNSQVEVAQRDSSVKQRARATGTSSVKQRATTSSVKQERASSVKP